MHSYKSLDTSLLQSNRKFRNIVFIITGFFVVNLLVTLISAGNTIYLLKKYSTDELDLVQNNELRNSNSKISLTKRFENLKSKIIKHYKRIDGILQNAETNILDTKSVTDNSKLVVRKIVKIVRESEEKRYKHG